MHVQEFGECGEVVVAEYDGVLTTYDNKLALQSHVIELTVIQSCFDVLISLQRYISYTSQYTLN